MCDVEEQPFCIWCAGNHSKGKCPPENFAYLECKECNQIIRMPFDAAGMMNGGGSGSSFCGCGAENSFELINEPTAEQMAEAM